MAPTLGSPALRFCKRRFGNGFKRTRGSIQIRQVEAASSLSAELRQGLREPPGRPARHAHGLGSRARVPTLPRLPLVPDPLRRIEVPRDLESVTTAGAEANPEAAGIDADVVDQIWSSAVDLYRAGVHPALALCRVRGRSRGRSHTSQARRPVCFWTDRFLRWTRPGLRSRTRWRR